MSSTAKKEEEVAMKTDEPATKKEADKPSDKKEKSASKDEITNEDGNGKKEEAGDKKDKSKLKKEEKVDSDDKGKAEGVKDETAKETAKGKDEKPDKKSDKAAKKGEKDVKKDEEEKHSDETKEEKKDDKKRKAEDEEPKADGKRKRKSSAPPAYTPEDFSVQKSNVVIVKGRGVKLGSLKSVKESIEHISVNSEDLELAYRFLLMPRGKMPKKYAKEQLLNFSGYLPEQKEDEDTTKREKADEDLEVRILTVFDLFLPPRLYHSS
jgi:hypothetical protein